MEEQRLLKKKRKAVEENSLLALAECCSTLGNLYNDRGEHEKALPEFRMVVKSYKDLNKPIEMATAHRMLGETYSDLVHFDLALKHINIYLKIAQTENHKIETQRAFATLGRVHLLQGQTQDDKDKAFRLAEKSFIKSLILCQEMKGQIAKSEFNDMQARLYLNIGVTKENIADYAESMRYYDKAIQMCQANDLHELLHQCYTTAALLYSGKINDTAKSLKMLNSALEVAKRLSNKSQKLCETLGLKADVLIKMGDFQSAKQILHKAYKIQSPIVEDRKKIEKTLKVVAAICYTEDSLITTDSDDYKQKKVLFEKMGDGACKLENYSIACEYYLKMLKNAKLNGDSDKALIPCYVSLYQTYIDNREYKKALEYLEEELKLIENVPKEAFNTLMNIAGVYEGMGEAKSFWDTERIYQSARKEAQKLRDVKMEKIALKKLLDLHKKHNYNDVAENLKKEAKLAGIDMDTESSDKEDDSDDESSVEGDTNTPNIGDDICLDDLSDSCSETEENTAKPLKPTRARRQTFAVKRNCKGETQLHQACISGNAILARRLIDQGHPVAIRDHAGWLPLHEASIHGHKEIAEMLLDRDRTMLNDKGGTSCDGITPLYDACSNGNLHIVELLLDRGANVTLKTDLGESVLDVLEKWHNTVNLEPSDEIFYDTIRERIFNSLDKVVDLNNTKKKVASPPTTTKPKSIASSSAQRPSNDDDILVDLYPTPSNSTTTSTANRPSASGSKSKAPEIGRMRHSLAYSDSESDEYGSVSTTKSINLDDSSEELVSVFAVRSPIKNPSLKKVQKTNACSEYKNVMQGLRNRFPGAEENDDDAGMVKRRTGHLNRQEVGESWLDDDLGPNKKRQKFITDAVFDMHGTSAGKSVTPKRLSNPLNEVVLSTEKRKSKETSVASTSVADDYSSVVSINELFDEDSVDAFDMMMINETNSEDRSKRRRSSASSSAQSRQQTSLLDAGFARFRSESPLLEQVSNAGLIRHKSFNRHLPDSTSNVAGFFNMIEQSPQKTAALSIPMSVKVKVEDQLLLVPINSNSANDLTIGWLAEETARRYYNLKGLRPELRLMTPDGAVFEGSDPISLAIGVNISSTVLDWKLPPLSQRYMEACSQMKCAVDQDFHNTMDLCQATQNLSLAHQNLTVTLSKPIFKALNHQTNLMFLDLANNCLQNDGLKFLVQALPTLTQLKSLNLSSNMITATGVECLAAIFEHDTFALGSNTVSAVLPNLNELELNYNPLGNDSVKGLAKVCNSLPQLRKLGLVCCKLESFYDFDLNFGNLLDLNVSYNQLSPEAVRKLLTKLNSCIISRLNLDFCCEKMENFGKDVATFFDSGTGTCLSALHLSNLNLNDSDLWEIACSIKKCDSLKELHLLQNPLTTVSLKYLLTKLPNLKVLHLDGCNKLLRSLDTAFFQESNERNDKYPELVTLSVSCAADRFEQINSLEVLWKQCWGEKAKIDVRQNRVKLYTKMNM